MADSEFEVGSPQEDPSPIQQAVDREDAGEDPFADDEAPAGGRPRANAMYQNEDGSYERETEDGGVEDVSP